MRTLPSFRALSVWIALLVLSAPLTRLAGAAQTGIPMNDDAEAVIGITTINSFWDGIGWQPVVVRIENRAARARTWEFEFTASSSHENSVQVATPVTVTVPARTTSESFALVAGPGWQDSTSWTTALRVRVTGPGVSANRWASLSTVREISFGLLAFTPHAEINVRRMMGTMVSTGGPPLYEFETVDPARWPADWRVWSSFRNLVLTGEDYDALDGARRNALHEWVAQGGYLLVDRVPVQSASGGVMTSVGFGRIYNPPRDLKGDLMSVAASNSQQRNAPWAKVARLLTNDDRADWALTKPVLVLVGFLVLFGIVVGPVNVFFFAPASRRQRLFVTVPVLSIGASLVLGLIIVVKDGFGGQGTRRSLVMLMPGENKALVFQQQVSRTGVLMRKEFSLPADTMIAMGDGGSSGVDSVQQLRRDGESLSGAWFTSRATQSHDLRRITPTRARVELVAGGTVGEAPVVQSSVTAVLRDFRYVDKQGKRWVADELPPGRRVTLSPTNTMDAGDTPGVFRAFGAASELAPLATHASIRWRDDIIIYTGRVEGARQP